MEGVPSAGARDLVTHAFLKRVRLGITTIPNSILELQTGLTNRDDSTMVVSGAR